MIGISIATKWEWDATLDYFKVHNNTLIILMENIL